MSNAPPTCLDVLVACARNPKLAIVNDVDKYELNVLFSEEPSRRDKKYGVAVIRAVGIHEVRKGHHSTS